MSLPVEEIRDRLVAPFPEGRFKRILLRAPTGSGKSTMVPLMLEEAGIDHLILVVQPRRIAARMLAYRVAHLFGCSIGDQVGYAVRFEKRRSAKTKILFVTDGVFSNWFEKDPDLLGVGAVIFDEFHERRVAGDVTLAKCLKLQETKRVDLTLIVMSATLQMGNLSNYLGDCRELEASGRSFPVEIEYVSAPLAQRGGSGKMQEKLWDRCLWAAKKAIVSADVGHILIFLPGVFEIKKTVNLLESSSVFSDWKICPLYSSLQPELQDLAVAPSNQPRIIVSTNVAETSLTIEGVRTVIDSGLARISEYDPNRGIQTLLIQHISQAAADQRAGRAGRMATGRCIRLWSRNSHRNRPEFELPEIQRTDVAELMLRFAAAGESIKYFRWLDTPNQVSIETAESTLKFLGALTPDGGITVLGAKMARLPLPPKFGRLVLAGYEEGCLAETCFIAAIIQGEGLFLKRHGTIGRGDYIYPEDCCDFVGEWRAFKAAQRVHFEPNRCRDMGLRARGAQECETIFLQLSDCVKILGFTLKSVDFTENAKAVINAGLKAFGDKIGKRNSVNTLASKLGDGRRGMIEEDSCVKDSELFIPTEITEVDGKKMVVYFKRNFSLSTEALIKGAGSELEQKYEVEFNPVLRKVVGKKVSIFRGQRILEEMSSDPDPLMASALLAQKVVEGELVLKNWDKEVETWISRLLGLRDWMPELALPTFSDEDKMIVIEQVCEGANSYKEIKDREVMPALKGWLSNAQNADLDRFAPKEIDLQNGRRVRVFYKNNQIPWIVIRAQHLFGVRSTPTIANDKVKLKVHICAPNNRVWQITDDLENFWKSGFAQMRKDLAGRYPKHSWQLNDELNRLDP